MVGRQVVSGSASLLSSQFLAGNLAAAEGSDGGESGSTHGGDLKELLCLWELVRFGAEVLTLCRD